MMALMTDMCVERGQVCIMMILGGVTTTNTGH